MEQLEKIHNLQLKMAEEVKRICDKHGIRYFMIAGTLLGAVRHKGFIPWDDDLDIGLLRTDYDEFLKVAVNELSSTFFLQTWDSDEKFGLPIAKLRLNNTKYIEKSSEKTGSHEGIYIDIFPFDNVPENKFFKKKQEIFTYTIKRLLYSKLGYQLWNDEQIFKKIIYKFLYFTSYIIPLENLKKILYKEMTRYNGQYSNKVVTIGGAYGYSKESIKRSWTETLIELPFENIAFLAPAEFEKYLTHFYGDYMTPPPLNNRYNRHNIIKVDFADY